MTRAGGAWTREDRRQLLQRRDVVEDPKRTALRRGDEIVVHDQGRFRTFGVAEGLTPGAVLAIIVAVGFYGMRERPMDKTGEPVSTEAG